MINLQIDPAGLKEFIESVVTLTVAKLRENDERNVAKSRTLQTEKLLLPADEASAACSISARLLWDLTAPRGPIRSVRAGSRVLYPVKELQRWIETQVTSPTAGSTE